MLSHGHMPAGLMKTAIVPILKNRQGDTSDKNNYRPIAIVIALSKIFELCIMRMIETHLVTSDNQFGFKREHGTDLCIYTVKSVIKYYNLHNSPVHTCFLDASKAYDRVNHWTLFKKLLDRSVHILVVRMLMFWYTRQELCIKWGAEMSSFFTISNGVRQGGILSPSLFAVYMDDLSSLLNASRIGCHISDVCINHVFYADDLCLMAPCAIALQELLNICYRYSVEVNLNFNATKSFCVASTPKHYKLSLPPLFMNISPIMYTDSIKYLGFTFTSNHCDDADILKQMRMLYCRSNRLVRLFNKCSKPVLLELCRSFCTIFYCPYFWTNYKKTTLSKIRVAYNNVYRKILGVSRRSSASAMFVTNDIPNFEAFFRKSIYSFTTRISFASNNRHISYIKNKISKGMGIIIKARKYLNRKSLLDLYHAFVYPYLTYCIEVWGNMSNVHLDALVKIQKKNVRIITYSPYLAHTDELFKEFNILPIHKLMLQRVALQMFKYSINILPDVISELFITNDTFHSHNTRSKNKLRPKMSNREYMYKNFSFIGVYIWNNIQDHIPINTSYAAFKSNTKKYFQYNNIIYRVT